MIARNFFDRKHANFVNLPLPHLNVTLKLIIIRLISQPKIFVCSEICKTLVGTLSLLVRPDQGLTTNLNYLSPNKILATNIIVE